jgi:hypothetical protein
MHSLYYSVDNEKTTEQSSFLTDAILEFQKYIC